MAEQESMLPVRSKGDRLDPDQHGLWSRVVLDGQINHAAWLRACAESSFVGTCKQCGSYLLPEHPTEVDGRTDYEATCQFAPTFKGVHGGDVIGTGHTLLAPGGRVWKASAQWRLGPASNHKRAKS